MNSGIKSLCLRTKSILAAL